LGENSGEFYLEHDFEGFQELNLEEIKAYRIKSWRLKMAILGDFKN
jgi:hypothetical protein